MFGYGASASSSGVDERAVDLDDVDVRAARGEVLAEHAEPAADLQHDVVGLERGGALDDAEDVRVDQEVLAEVALRAHVEAPQAPQRRLRRQVRPGGGASAAAALTTRTASAALRVDEIVELARTSRRIRSATNDAVCAT